MTRARLRVRLTADWASDAEVREDFNRYSPTGDYRWRELELTLAEDFDRLVVFNRPQQRLARPAAAILFQCETRSLRERIEAEVGDWLREIPVRFETAASFQFPGWSIPVSYRELEASPAKTRALSAVVSGKTWLPRQAARVRFAAEVLPRLPHYDHFGRDGAAGGAYRGAIADKGAALLPYRYTFAAENEREPNYFTEKLHDALVCECLAFYDGCPNVADFVDPDCLVAIDTDDPEAALETVQAAIARGEWERRASAIRAQKRRLMTELNPLEIIRKAIAGEAILWREGR